MSIPLRPELYGLSEDEAVFYRSQTGIEDDEELKNHILTVQAEAYKASLGPHRHQGSGRLNCRSLFVPDTSVSLYTHILFSEVCTNFRNCCPTKRQLRGSRLGISKHPSYQRFLAIGREREGAIYLEIACCCEF